MNVVTTFFFSIVSCMMFSCFALLSSFGEVLPCIIAVNLIASNVDQTFKQIAMSNTISQALAKEQVGAVWYIFLLNFISCAISMSLIGKMLDTKQTALHLNPFVINENATCSVTFLLSSAC